MGRKIGTVVLPQTNRVSFLTSCFIIGNRFTYFVSIVYRISRSTSLVALVK